MALVERVLVGQARPGHTIRALSDLRVCLMGGCGPERARTQFAYRVVARFLRSRLEETRGCCISQHELGLDTGRKLVMLRNIWINMELE